MESPLFIEEYCVIRNYKLTTSDQTLQFNPSLEINDWIKAIYKEIGMHYPKFFKMDNVCKLSVLATEKVLASNLKEDIGLFFVNNAGSMDSDCAHQATIEDKDNYYPSPATFVYTLSNICAGEIAIRHKLQTENIFLINDVFDAQLYIEHVGTMLSTQKCSKVLLGWVEVMEEKVDVFIALVGPTKGKINFTKNSLESIYKYS